MSAPCPDRFRRAVIAWGIPACVALLAAVATAAVPLEGSGSLDISMIEHTSHSPCATASARIPTSAGPTFLATGGIDYGYCLDGTWSIACTASGLVYECSVAGVPDWYEWGRWAQVIVRVECVLPVTETTTLTAARSFTSGPVVVLAGVHDVLLTTPDGIESSLFAGDPDAATATRSLEPGEWRVAIDVDITLSDRNLMEYTGSLVVDWDAAVPNRRTSWGAAKMIYR